MFRRSLHIWFILLAGLSLAGFRMPTKNDGRDTLLYDVRGAFVTAKPDIPAALVTATDLLVDQAIRSTLRPTILPRTIIVIRIDQASNTPLLLGSRYEARVTVQAVSVGDGEPVAQGSFQASIYAFGSDRGDEALAQKIAARIASEFKLDGPRRGSLASALAE